jgi:hypothetical protein
MLIVIGKMAYVNRCLATVTAMTLMMVLYGLILERGVHLYFLGPYPFILTRRTRRTEQGVPYICGFPTYDWRRV